MARRPIAWLWVTAAGVVLAQAITAVLLQERRSSLKPTPGAAPGSSRPPSRIRGPCIVGSPLGLQPGPCWDGPLAPADIRRYTGPLEGSLGYSRQFGGWRVRELREATLELF
jgi:hypothetical protein